MKFRRDAPAVLIGAVVLVVATTTVLSNRLFSGLTDSVEESQFQLMRAILDSGLRAAEDRALARADMVANLPATRQLVAARDRDRLLAEYGEMFRVQAEKYGVDQAQFHVPPAVSLLRLHAPATFGDDLSSFRPMVVGVNQDHLPRKGPEIARTGPAVFGVVPVKDPAGGGYAGTFEIGINFGAVLDSLKASYGLELALFVEEQPLRDFAKGVSGEVLSDQNRVGKYVKFHSTNWALMQRLAQAGDLATLDEPKKYTRPSLGLTYGVLLVPLRNAAGQPFGAIAVARDFSGSRAAAGRSLVWQVLLALFAIVLLAGVVLVVLRGFLLRPLREIGERFGTLAAGERGQVIADEATLCDELRTLARQYDRLRRQGGPARPPAADAGRGEEGAG